MEATAIDNSEKGALHGGGSSCEKGRRLHTGRLQPSSPEGRVWFTGSHISQCIFHLCPLHSEKYIRIKRL